MKRILLVRHADTGLGGRFIGRSDVPAAPQGLARIPALARELAAWRPVRAVASPMLRVRQTWEALAESQPALESCPLDLDPDLREVDFGRWEGLDFAQACQRDPQRTAAWTRDPAAFTFPGGEAVAAFHARVGRAGERIAALDGPAVLVLAHGGVIRSLICAFLGLEQETGMLLAVRPARLSVVELYSQGGVLAVLNR